MEINFDNINKLLNLTIKYNDLEENLKESLYVNLTTPSAILQHLYINIFDLNIPISRRTGNYNRNANPKQPDTNIQLSNEYFTLLDHLFRNCDILSLGEEVEEPLFKSIHLMDLFINNISDSIFNIKNKNVSTLDSLKYRNTILNTTNNYLRLINNQINRNCRGIDDIYQIVFWEYPKAIQYALFIKILYKFINPDLDLDDSKIGNLTILDFDPTITDEEKQKILEICQIYTKWIFRKNFDYRDPDSDISIDELFSEENEYYNYLKQYLFLESEFDIIPTVRYDIENSLINNIRDKINIVIEKIKFFLFTVFSNKDFGENLNTDLVVTNRIVGEMLSHIFNNEILYIFSVEQTIDSYTYKFNSMRLISYLCGFKVSYINYNNRNTNKKFDYIESINSIEDCKTIKTILNPLIKSIYVNDLNHLDTFNNNLKEYTQSNIFTQFINESNSYVKDKLLLKIFSRKSSGSLNLILPLKKERIIYLDPIINDEIDKKSLFNPDSDQDLISCPEKLEKFSNVLNITSQAFKGFALDPLYNIWPGFYERLIQYKGYGIEKGYGTGPTKQLIGEFIELFNYVIRYNETTQRVSYNIPLWLLYSSKEDKFLFYSFMTQFLLTTMSLNYMDQYPHNSQPIPTTFTFYLTFRMLVPTLIKIMEEPLNILENPLSTEIEKKESLFSIVELNKLFNKFDKFINVYDYKKKFFINPDNSLKYESLEEHSIPLYYRSICLYLIGDLLEGGTQYQYLLEKENPEFTEMILDPENEWLNSQNETYEPPPGFLDIDVLKDFYGGGSNIYNPRAYNDYSLGTSVKLDKIILNIYLIHKQNNILTSEKFIRSIRFENSFDASYNILFDYMKKLLTDYSIDLPNEIVTEIRSIFPTQLDFLNKFLKTWTASNSLRDTTVLQFVLESQTSIQIATCYNSLTYPINIMEYTEITYEDFVSAIIDVCRGQDRFGVGGKKRKTQKIKKHKKYIKLKIINFNKNKKTINKNKTINKIKKKKRSRTKN